ncbi:EamA family transporter, partial [Escherichia coli]
LYLLFVSSIALFTLEYHVGRSLLTHWLLAGLLFCGSDTFVGYGALPRWMTRWPAAQVSVIITLTQLFTLFFSDLLSLAWPDFFARPMLNLLGYLGAFVVVAGAMYSAIGHRIWGGLRKHTTVVSQPRAGE